MVKCGAIAAPRTFNLDIAMVKLSRPVRLNDNVNVICLPSREDRFPPGTVCVTAGWGHAVESEYNNIYLLFIIIIRIMLHIKMQIIMQTILLEL